VNAVLEVERLEAREHLLVHGDGMARRVVFEASIDEEEDVFSVEIFELQTVRYNEGNSLVGNAIETTEVEMSDVRTLLDQRN
jgi:hypothetical protein